MIPDRWLPNSWSSSNATSCPISDGISPVSPHLQWGRRVRVVERLREGGRRKGKREEGSVCRREEGKGEQGRV